MFLTVSRDRYDRVIVHNFFPLVSPSIYYAAHQEKVPVIQYLHNFRLFCLNGLFFRDGRICEDCFKKQIPWPGVIHRCYRGSYLGSIVVAAMLCVHRLLKTWTTKVDQFIALSEFSRVKFIEGGLPAGRIAAKPNFIGLDPGPGSGKGGYAVFIGRLSKEKGIPQLLSAWKELGYGIPLKILGEGPQAKEVERAIEYGENIEWFGKASNEKVIEVLKDASCLIFPSGCYENFPRVILEAYAVGTPVIAYNLGSTGEIVIPGRTGYLLPVGDSKALVECIQKAFQDPSELFSMRKSTR